MISSSLIPPSPVCFCPNASTATSSFILFWVLTQTVLAHSTTVEWEFTFGCLVHMLYMSGEQGAGCPCLLPSTRWRSDPTFYSCSPVSPLTVSLPRAEMHRIEGTWPKTDRPAHGVANPGPKKCWPRGPCACFRKVPQGSKLLGHQAGCPPVSV